MGKNVNFSYKIVAQAKAAAPSFAFSMFAQAAVREKIERERLLRHQLTGRTEPLPDDV
jgi:hypothetical protein